MRSRLTRSRISSATSAPAWTPTTPRSAPWSKRPPTARARKSAAPALKFFEAKKGFANYYFNRQERDRLLAAFRKHGDFTPATGDWAAKATGEVKGRKVEVRLAAKLEKDKDGKDQKTITSISLGG